MKKLAHKKQKNKICIGITKDNELVFAEIEIGSCDNNHYTITHTTFDEIMTEGEGEERAREYLEDGEMWKMAVESGNTTDSLEGWVDNVLNIDGWENQLDVRFFGSYDDNNYYLRWGSCGCSIDDLKKEYKKLLITEEERKILIESDKLHLKDFDTYTKKNKELFDKVLKLFNKISQDIEDFENLIPLLINEE